MKTRIPALSPVRKAVPLCLLSLAPFVWTGCIGDKGTGPADPNPPAGVVSQAATGEDTVKIPADAKLLEKRATVSPDGCTNSLRIYGDRHYAYADAYVHCVDRKDFQISMGFYRTGLFSKLWKTSCAALYGCGISMRLPLDKTKPITNHFEAWAFADYNGKSHSLTRIVDF